jgi:hypothetical protein
MTQPPRTTETINRDNEAIRDIMHQVRELTVPDRATLALGLVGHLATMMNRSQMTKLMDELQDEAERVQDVPPGRQRADERGRRSDAMRPSSQERAAAAPGSLRSESRDDGRAPAHDGVGQAGRGEFRSGRLL